MKKIESFCVNHLVLKKGLYVSRVDSKDGVFVTTFDIRMSAPNIEPCLDSGAMHTIEHIGATFLRNSSVSSEIVYFGPMGCKTGFYLVMFGKLAPFDVADLVKDMLSFVASFDGEIPGATPRDCGNYSLQNLDMAKFYAKAYIKELEEFARFEYQD